MRQEIGGTDLCRIGRLVLEALFEPVQSREFEQRLPIDASPADIRLALGILEDEIFRRGRRERDGTADRGHAALRAHHDLGRCVEECCGMSAPPGVRSRAPLRATRRSAGSLRGRRPASRRSLPRASRARGSRRPRRRSESDERAGRRRCGSRRRGTHSRARAPPRWPRRSRTPCRLTMTTVCNVSGAAPASTATARHTASQTSIARQTMREIDRPFTRGVTSSTRRSMTLV